MGPPNLRRGQCEGHRSLRRCKREPNRELELVQVYQSGQQYNCKTLKHDVKGHAAAGISNVENHRDTGHPGPGPGTMMISFQLLDLNSDSESLACFEFSASDSDSGSHSLPVVLATPSGSARLRPSPAANLFAVQRWAPGPGSGGQRTLFSYCDHYGRQGADARRRTCAVQQRGRATHHAPPGRRRRPAATAGRAAAAAVA